MSQNYTEAITNSSTHPRSVFYCPQALGVSWELNSVTFTWILAAIILIASPITIILNALIIIAVKQRKELQKHSNILLSSMAVADLLVGAITLPLGATVDLLIFYQVSLEHVCTLSIANKDLMACFLLSSLYHLTGIAWERYVAVRKWKDYRVIVTRSRIKKLAVFAWLSAIFSTVPSPIMQAIGVDLDVLKFRIVSGNVCGAVALTVLVYFYLMVYLGVRKRQTSEISQVTAQLQAKHEFKIAKTTVLLTATLIFMLLFGALPIVLGVSFQVVRANVAIRMSETLVQLNSVINPIIYCYRDRRFRNAVLELLRIRKLLAIQPTDGSVRYRRRKSRFGSQENVQQELKTEGKFPHLARFASCDPTVGLNDEMMLKRTMSASSPVKFRKICHDLQLQKPSPVTITTAVIHALCWLPPPPAPNFALCPLQTITQCCVIFPISPASRPIFSHFHFPFFFVPFQTRIPLPLHPLQWGCVTNQRWSRGSGLLRLIFDLGNWGVGGSTLVPFITYCCVLRHKRNSHCLSRRYIIIRVYQRTVRKNQTKILGGTPVMD